MGADTSPTSLLVHLWNFTALGGEPLCGRSPQNHIKQLGITTGIKVSCARKRAVLA
jgi:hypothetical protein